MSDQQSAEVGAWPILDYVSWRDSCAALHLWTQIIGKYRLACTPWVRHSWHATLYVTPVGLTTGTVPDRHALVTVTLDLINHRCLARSSTGCTAGFDLEPMSIAEFHRRTCSMLEHVGATADFHGLPNEVEQPIAFATDTAQRPYDALAVSRYHAALCRIEPVLQRFATGYLGKVSPVHLFWGSFDLAVTRFSGRTAPLHPGGIPNLPDTVTHEAYSHEVSSAGFWPGGGGGVDQAMFYSYAYPTPVGFAEAEVKPAAASFDPSLSEFLLSYEAVRAAADPERALLSFLQSTYVAAADAAGWDQQLECPIGVPGVPRELSA